MSIATPDVEAGRVASDTLLGLTSDFKDVIVELIRASKSNPLIGIVLAIVTVNILKKAKIIDATVEIDLLLILNAAVGVDLLADVLRILTTEPIVDLVRPTMTVSTEAENRATGETETTTAKATGQSAVTGLLGALVKHLPEAAAAAA